MLPDTLTPPGTVTAAPAQDAMDAHATTLRRTATVTMHLGSHAQTSSTSASLAQLLVCCPVLLLAGPAAVPCCPAAPTQAPLSNKVKLTQTTHACA